MNRTGVAFGKKCKATHPGTGSFDNRIKCGWFHVEMSGYEREIDHVK